MCMCMHMCMWHVHAYVICNHPLHFTMHTPPTHAHSRAHLHASLIVTAGGAEETTRQALVQRGEDTYRSCAGDRVTHRAAAHVRLHK